MISEKRKRPAVKMENELLKYPKLDSDAERSGMKFLYDYLLFLLLTFI